MSKPGFHLLPIEMSRHAICSIFLQFDTDNVFFLLMLKKQKT